MKINRTCLKITKRTASALLTLFMCLGLLSGSTLAIELKQVYKPDAPSNLTATVNDDKDVVLSWTDNSSNEKRFDIHRKLQADTEWATVANTDANVTTYTDTTPELGKTYEYKVVAVNVVPLPLPHTYYSADSNIATATILAPFVVPPVIPLPITAPNAPTNLNLPTGYQAQPTAVSLVWADQSNNEAAFIIERKVVLEGLNPLAVWLEVGEVAANTTAFTETGLTAATAYEYRVRAYRNHLLLKVYSDYSNVLTTTTAQAPVTPPVTPPVIPPGTYPGVSSWAEAEVLEAVAAGLTTPDILSDFQRPITREEFCEIAVKLYEASAQLPANPVAVNPFKDTTNTEILKAYALGIVKGVSADSFAPNLSITRQEICVMLLRTMKAINPNGDYSTDGVGAFADESKIDDWAIDAVRYMNKVSIMKGVGENRIDPLGNTTREQAILLVLRTKHETAKNSIQNVR